MDSSWRSLLPVGAVVAAAVITGLLIGSALTGDGGGSDTDRQRNARAEPRQQTRGGPTGPSDQPPPSTSAANATGLNDQGFRLMNAGRYEEAIPLLERAVDAARDGSLTQAYALYNLGRSLRLVGRPDEAIPLLER